MASYYTRSKVRRTSEIEPSECSDVEPGEAAPSAAATSPLPRSTIVRPTVAAAEESESMATEPAEPVSAHSSPAGRPTSLGGPGARVNTPPPRRRGCYVCGQPGCYSDFHGPRAVSPQAPPAMGCFVCGQRGCHSSRHEANPQQPVPNAPSQPVRSAPAPTMGTASPQSNWQRGSNQGERAPQTNVPPRPQSNYRWPVSPLRHRLIRRS